MPTSFADAAHLLRRSGFGGTPDEIHALTRLSRDEAVDRVCDLTAAPPVDPPSVVQDLSASWWDRYVAMAHWWLRRMVTTPTPLQEKMTLFWHGHLVSAMAGVGDHRLMLAQNLLLRRHAMGDFLDLAQRVSLDPAMLVYLDNESNVVGRPNENFARELMELFLLGQGHYSQDDVVAAARAWTGHGLSWNGDAAPTYRFVASRHDSGSKTFLGITRNWDGPDVVEEILAGSRAQAAARFLVTKLWSFFAYPGPEPEVVSDLAGTYLAGGRNVRALMRALFRRPEFWSEKARRGLVRSPAEFVVAAMRHTGLGPDVAHPEWWAESMGQVLFDPPNVSGWRQNGYWISSAATWGRAGFASHLAWRAQQAGVLAGTRQLSPETAVQRAFDTFGITDPSPATRAALEAYVRDERRTAGWAEQPFLVVLSLLTPEFQLA